jgi:hypothetical protein
MSTGEPTYWPTDLKIPDLLDFAITKGISDIYSSIKSNLDMSSDHSPIVITLSNHVIWEKKPHIQLYNRDTNWTQFQDHINDSINLNLQLKVNQDLEDAVDYITRLIQTAAWTSTPNRERTIQDPHNLPLHIRELIQEKCRASRRWQNSRNLLDKTELNKLTHNLRSVITQAKDKTFKTYITNLSPDDHSLWKATKKCKRLTIAIPPIRKQDGSWARTNKEKTNLLR